MADKKSDRKSFKTIPDGTKVHWRYRGATGHGTVIGIASKGDSEATTRYRVRETDHHPGEKSVLIHTGKALKR